MKNEEILKKLSTIRLALNNISVKEEANIGNLYGAIGLVAQLMNELKEDDSSPEKE